MSAPTRAVHREAHSARADIPLALDRATGTRAIAGNRVVHHPDSAGAIDEMLLRITQAEQSIHLENYIIRHDHTGRRFAAALEERARAGVAVRVLYDALGSFGTRRSFWQGLRRAGAEVRAFHPLLKSAPFDLFSRDHGKLLLVDGSHALVGGLCIGDEWAGDPRRGRKPWRDTMVAVAGPATAALQRAFARTWRRAGPPLPAAELAVDPPVAGTSAVRVVAGIPGRARVYRAVQILTALAVERLWITDAYFVAPPPLFAALLDAARGGVDVRLLVPGASDLPVLRSATRSGYRDLLQAGVRIFEWAGPMLHAKTMLADRHWARIGSSNLNMSSLLTNYEIDVLVDCDELTQVLAAQFRHDLAHAREIVLKPRRYLRRPALVGAPATPEAGPPPAHKRSGYEVGTAAVVTLSRVAGGLRRAILGAAALTLLIIGALLLAFPRVMSVVLATGAFWLALGFLWYGAQQRRAQKARDGDAQSG